MKSKNQLGNARGRRSVIVQRSKSQTIENAHTISSASIFSIEALPILAPSKSKLSSPSSPPKSVPRKDTFKPSTRETVAVNNRASGTTEGSSGRLKDRHSTEISDWSLSHLPTAFEKLSGDEFMFVSHILTMGYKTASRLASALDYKLDRERKSLQGYSLALRNAINKQRAL